MPDETLPPDGALDGLMSRVFGKSWKTGLAGFIGLACSVLPLVPGVPPQALEVAKVLGPIVMGGGLFFAKDHNVSGKS